MTPTITNHGTTVEVRHDPAMHYVAQCLCGWSGNSTTSRPVADAQGEAHLNLEAVAATHSEPTPQPVPGWQRPTWATEVHLDGNRVSFERPASMVPLHASSIEDDPPRPTTVCLSRYDRIEIDADRGTIRVIEPAPTVLVGDDTVLSVPEARKLAAALIELADAAEATS